MKHKNIDLLLTAFDRIAFDNMTLGIIGEGPEREYLEAKAAQLESVDQITFLGFLDKYEDVLGYMRAASVFTSPSTREGFGLTYAGAMAADCTVIAADHPDTATDEVIGDIGFCINPTVYALTKKLSAALSGTRPPTAPVDHAQQYDWNAIADQAETIYQHTIDDNW